MLFVAREDGGAVNQRAAERLEMFKHEPASFPPGHEAENPAVEIHRGRHVRRGKREINRRRHGQKIGDPQAKHAQRRDEKPDAPMSATQLAGTGPMFLLRIVSGHAA
jgi:hypothetical protein